MVDYFAGNENGGPADANAPAAANGAVQQPAAGGEDLGMAEISVSFPCFFMRCGRTDTDPSCSKCFMMYHFSFYSRRGRSLLLTEPTNFGKVFSDTRSARCFLYQATVSGFLLRFSPGIVLFLFT